MRGLSVQTEISDFRQVVCLSRKTVDYYVHARQSLKNSFKILTCVAWPTDSDPLWTGDIPRLGVYPNLDPDGEKERAAKKKKNKAEKEDGKAAAATKGKKKVLSATSWSKQ